MRKGSRKGNRVEVDGLIAKVFFNRGGFFIVDKKDLKKITQYTWHTNHGREKNGKKYGVYARTYVYTKNYDFDTGWKATCLLAHRLICSPPKGFQVDHANGNTLDNRRCNLRVVTQSNNQRNQRIRTKNKNLIPGVSFYKRDGNYRVQMSVNGKNKHFGYFETKEKAEKFLKQKHVEFFGEYSPYFKSGEKK